jgi:hypothetical protein
MLRRIVSYFLVVASFLFTNCYIEEEYSFEEGITGKWAFSDRRAYLNDGTSFRSLPTDRCEFETEFIFSEDGTLVYMDYTEKENNDLTSDFCELDLSTDEKGIWNVLPTDKLSITLKSNEDGSDIRIEPFEVTIVSKDQWNLRYYEF